MRRGLRKLLTPIRDERCRKAVFRVRRHLTPITDDTLRRTLDKLIDSRPELMLMHSSLSTCGRFTAGPNRVLDTLRDYVGTLVLVTHSYNYPEAPEKLGPVFDRGNTPSKSGHLTNLFWQRPGVLRSIHATHSLAAHGSRAAEITADHYRWDSPTGPGTPYMRLIAQKSSAMMFGVSFAYYTFFHSAEFDSGSEYAYQHDIIDRLRVIDETGAVRECLSRRQNWAATRFAEVGELMERKGLVYKIALGREFLRFVPDTSKAHDFLVERLRKTPNFLRQVCEVELDGSA
jgi:aminoglycoside 3-N-acetyltransferase